MYNHIWKKYLPFINIQLKRSANGDQVMNLNRVDFERAGTGRKAGYKFMIQFTEGRVSNVISGSALAMNLASVMLEDDNTKKILKQSQYEISLNTKFQLLTKNTRAAKAPEEETTEDKIETPEPEETEVEK
jgi:Leu/Phe-tRNA-protein transferase